MSESSPRLVELLHDGARHLLQLVVVRRRVRRERDRERAHRARLDGGALALGAWMVKRSENGDLGSLKPSDAN